jgi:hypothetical protein
MMNYNIKQIFRNILEEHDNNTLKINKKLENYKYFKLKYNSLSNEMSEISLYDNKKKEILNCKYQLLSIYVPNLKLWKWAWSLPAANKKHSFVSRKILNYALDIENINMLFIREPLINSNIIIENDLELELLIGISSYLTKQNFIKGFYFINENEGVLNNIKKVEESDNINDYMIHYYILMDQ